MRRETSTPVIPEEDISGPPRQPPVVSASLLFFEQQDRPDLLLEPTFVGGEYEAWADRVGITLGLIALIASHELNWYQVLQLFGPES